MQKFIKNKKRVLLVLVLSFITIFLLDNSSFSKSSIEWYSFNAGIKKAKSQKKHIVIDMYASWCHWCKVMDKETFEDSEVVKKIKKDYIPIRLDMDSRARIKYQKYNLTPNELSKLFGVQGLPTVVFMDKNGKFIDKLAGFIKPKLFSAILEYIKAECYKKDVTFKDYMGDKTKCK